VTLSAQSLTKRYGTASDHEAVRDASLELEAGEFVSIVGRSGSGKSTLMAMLGALTRPTEGKLLLDGTDVWTLSEAELATFRSRYIGFIFQFPSLLSNLTAVDNVAVPALLGRTMDAAQAYARAYELLARVGLRDRADAYPGSMSGGEQRRVAIARALINSPLLLLADEPTSDLDEDTETDIIDLLEQLQRTESFGFVLVTHNLELAKRARRSFEMRQGTLAEADLPQISAEPDRPRRFGPAEVQPPAALALPAASRVRIRLGSNLWRGVQAFLLAGAVIFGGILLTDFGIDKYQKMRIRERAARIASLQHLALNSLRGDVQSVADLGDGRYELTTYLQNVGGAPIYGRKCR
jgi:putative ABC transport system ATP-binding protein/macrolide transport system ATP-binding/permease protein/lipoprotein-releasing system ATP-binding protein